MSNEAAERLRANVMGYLGADAGDWLDMLHAALAAERKATAERIRAAYAALDDPRIGIPAILDAEAAR